ncbi:MAG TPA: prepilin-type N-terminal cleavage/methylation domain-containing protein [Methylomirabilota bacterium]|nr:prepilin-type N-terminal cleavage/methylation domain-containing protein [Methylomirabilota bacterium]
MSHQAGFTLLEVLVALLILGLAVVSLIQLSSQGLRLVKLSGDQQQAVLLADRLVRATAPLAEGVESGQEGPLTWERRVAVVGAPDELSPLSGPTPELLALTVTVHWGMRRSLQLASLRLTPREAGR